MDGLLIVDKPVGPTSHDVVSRMRRVLGERRIGHTGTLDPAASGVLPLVIGRATRLGRFLSAACKSYEALVRLGVATDTYDAEGPPVSAPAPGRLPSLEAIGRVLEEFRGTFLQHPPAYSAKKIAGRRSYELARARSRTSGVAEPPETAGRPAPVVVTVYRLEIAGMDDDRLTLTLDCSSGFYVRSLAHDLGQRLGLGAHLGALRRTASAGYTLADAVAIEWAERNPDAARRALIPLSGMLTALPSVVLSDEGVRRAAHGREIGLGDVELGSDALQDGCGWTAIRLVDRGGQLVAIAERAGTPGLLHPSVVLM